MRFLTVREVAWANRELYVAWAVLCWSLTNCLCWLVWRTEPGFQPNAFWLENLRWCQWLLVPSFAACLWANPIGKRRMAALLERLRAAG